MDDTLTYVYECQECEKEFEADAVLADEALCPQCADKQEALDGLYLTAEQGKAVADGRKKAVVKLKKIGVAKPFELVAGSEALGVVRLGKPEKIDLQEFAVRREAHGVSDQERAEQFGDAETFWFYPVKSFRAYEQPRGTTAPDVFGVVEVTVEPGATAPAAEPSGKVPLVPQPFPKIPAKKPVPLVPVPVPQPMFLSGEEPEEDEKEDEKDFPGHTGRPGRVGGSAPRGGAAGDGGGGREAAMRHTISEHEETEALKRVGDAAQKHERERYEIEPVEWPRGGYGLYDKRKLSFAGQPRTITTGSRSEVDKELEKRLKTARTRAQNDLSKYVKLHNDTVKRGFYDDNLEGAARDKEKLLSGKSLESDEEEKAGRRLRGDKVSLLKELQDQFVSLVERLKEMIGWAEYDDQDEPTALEVLGAGMFEEESGLAVKLVGGKPWLLVWSTNAFQDRQQEIFATHGLEDWADRAIEKDDKGFIDWWHIPGTEFARKEWVGVPGRILAEAGPFLDDEKGRAALHFFESYPKGHPDIAPEGYGCSPKFKYLPEERAKGVFENIEIVATSVLPRFAAANVHFGNVEVLDMLTDKQKKSCVAVFGEDLAQQIIEKAETASKAKEDQGVAFKSEQDAEAEAEKAMNEFKSALREIAGMVEDEEAAAELKKLAGELKADNGAESGKAVKKLAGKAKGEAKARLEKIAAALSAEEGYPKPYAKPTHKALTESDLGEYVAALREIAGTVGDEAVAKALTTAAEKLKADTADEVAGTVRMLSGKAEGEAKARLEKLAAALSAEEGYPKPTKEFAEEVASLLLEKMSTDFAPIAQALTGMAEAVQAVNERMDRLEKNEALKSEAELPRWQFQLFKRASEADETEVKEGDPLLSRKPKEAAPSSDPTYMGKFFGSDAHP